MDPTIDGPAAISLGLRIAGDTGALVGAGRIAAHLVTGARFGALVVVHAAGGVRRLWHLILGAVAACPLRRQFAVEAAVQCCTSSVLFIYSEVDIIVMRLFERVFFFQETKWCVPNKNRIKQFD